MKKFIPVLPFVALIILVVSMTFFRSEPPVTQDVADAANDRHIGFSKKESDEEQPIEMNAINQ